MNSRAQPELRPAITTRGVTAKALRAFAEHGARDRINLVCIPWCGAGASVFRRFAACVPDDMALHAVQLPGREECFGQPRLRRMADVVNYMLPEVAALCADPHKPMVLFGHSMGAVVAFELTRALAREFHVGPSLLIVSGHGSPTTRRHTTFQWHTAVDADLIANIRSLGGTPETVLLDGPLMRTLLPLMKADYEVLETYTPHAATGALHCPLIACAGREDREVTLQTLNAWRDTTNAESIVHWFDGHHFYLHETPVEVMQTILSWIAQMPRRPVSPNTSPSVSPP
ncbi:MAG: putative thioesterase [Rhodocyclales bacterium]|nr:putative thioesterase [Rhodocyclales bacterium]